MYDNLTVYVNNVCKSYGSNKILNKIYVSVERGTIYGLLGPSGCGKTTLLNCIVGRNKIDDGEIWILGEKAGGSPGATVGYMPQNVALVSSFTVKEAIYFFGRIFEMDPFELYNRFNQLKRMLDLPPDGRFICNCSGGQQRRVSLAAALIHQPELLILDEPTVGVDSILRERIWNHLNQIVNEEGTTVIITTHYIEEARQANRIGLMRGGKLLVEDAPAKLLRMYNCNTLEEIFFILSERQEKGTNSNIISTIQDNMETITQSTDTVNLYSSTDEILKKKKRYSKNRNTILSMDRIIALMIKHIMSLYRNKAGLALLLAMPFVQMVLFMAAVGREVHDLPVAVINDEVAAMKFSTACSDIALSETVQMQNDTCHIEHISCKFMTYLQHDMMRLKYYNSTSEAVEDIRRGKLIGVIHIASNISERMENRFSDDSDSEQPSQGEIEVFLDMADAQVGSSLKTKLTNQYLDFQMDVLDKCNMSKLARSPLAFKEFYFGHKDDPLIVFMTPGLCMMIIFFMGVMSAAAVILDEKIEGIWDRSIVAGVTALELTMVHFIVQIFLLFLMILSLMVAVFVIHRYECATSIWIVFGFIYLQGLCGAVFGFMVSVLSSSHSMANVIITGIMNPLTIITGVFWPLEAMPYSLQIFSRLSPLTIPIEAFRNVTKKGWDLCGTEGYIGIGMLAIWILIPAISSWYIMKMKR